MRKSIKHKLSPKRLKSVDPSSLVKSRLFIVAVCIGIGVVLLLSTKAATSTASIEPENGTRTPNAQSIASAAASGGSYVKFIAQGATGNGGMGPDCLSPRTLVVNRQQLWCETHASHEPAASGSYIFPWAPAVHGQRSSSNLTYFTPVNGGAHVPPVNGLVGTSDQISGGSGDSDVESVHTWFEITSDSPTYVNADVEIKKQSMNVAFHIKSTNQWKTKPNTNGAVTGSNTVFSYDSVNWFSPVGGTGPAGGYLFGWNVGGGLFMDPLNNDDGSPGRIRHHGGEWMQQPISSGFGDVDAVVAWGQFRVVGPGAASAQYRAELGVDRRLYSSPGDIASYPGRLRRLYPEWQTLTVSTMSDTLLDKPGYADALVGIIPGYVNN